MASCALLLLTALAHYHQFDQCWFLLPWNNRALLQVGMDQPDCLKTLRGMLQDGPITDLYSGGGGGENEAKYGGPKPHEGFALRMPAEEVAHNTHSIRTQSQHLFHINRFAPLT